MRFLVMPVVSRGVLCFDGGDLSQHACFIIIFRKNVHVRRSAVADIRYFSLFISSFIFHSSSLVCATVPAFFSLFIIITIVRAFFPFVRHHALRLYLPLHDRNIFFSIVHHNFHHHPGVVPLVQHSHYIILLLVFPHHWALLLVFAVSEFFFQSPNPSLFFQSKSFDAWLCSYLLHVLIVRNWIEFIFFCRFCLRMIEISLNSCHRFRRHSK